MNSPETQSFPVTNSLKHASVKPEHVFKSFSPKLAQLLNPKKPDITGALILAQMAKWKTSTLEANARKAHSIGRIPAAYMEVEQIQAELPWLSKSAIYKSVNRLKALAAKRLKRFIKIAFKSDAVHCVIADNFKKRYQLGKKYVKGQNKKWITFNVHDAIDHGVTEACILQNLNHQLANWTNPVTDDEGNSYGILLPVKMTLPFSRESMARSISDLAKKSVIGKHPKRRSLYRINKCDVNPLKCDEKENRCDDKEIDCDDSGKALSCNYNITTINQLKLESVLLTTNALASPLRSSSLNPSLELETNSPNILTDDKLIVCVPTNPNGVCHNNSKLKLLMPEIMAQARARSAHYEQMKADGTLITVAEPDEEHHDEVGNLNVALWQEGDVLLDINTDRPFNRADYINYTMEHLELTIRICEFPYTKQDIQDLRELFIQYPLLEEEHIVEMLGTANPEDNPMWISTGKPTAIDKFDEMYFARRIKRP